MLKGTDAPGTARPRDTMNPTTNVLLVLGLPEPIAATYHDRLQSEFPQVKIDRVDHYSKVDPLIADAEVLITFPAMIRDETLSKAPRLKWAQALTTGVDGLIDLPSLRPDVIVTNVRGIHGAPVSESALLSMLALVRQMPRSIRAEGRPGIQPPARTTMPDGYRLVVHAGGGRNDDQIRSSL